MIITETEFNKLKIIMKSAKSPIIYSSEDDELNRKVMEKLQIEILLLNAEGKKDFLKQRNSGFNQVMAKIAKKKNISIGINLDELIESKEQARVIARVKQNIEICKKDKIQMQFVQLKNRRELHEIKSLGIALGMPTWMSAKLEKIDEMK